MLIRGVAGSHGQFGQEEIRFFWGEQLKINYLSRSRYLGNCFGPKEKMVASV